VGLEGDLAVGKKSPLPAFGSFRILRFGVVHRRLSLDLQDDPLARQKFRTRMRPKDGRACYNLRLQPDKRR